MLNIINILKKNQIDRIINNKGNNIYTYKRDIPLNKEWYNSIYTFDKNPIRFLPIIHNNIFKLLKGHFNMENKNLEIKVKSNKYKKIKRSFGNKVWVSTPEIKHFNDKINITIYVYNRLYNHYKKKLKLLNFNWGLKINHKNIKSFSKIIVQKKIKLLKPKNFTHLRNKKIYNNKHYIKTIKWFKLNKYVNMEKYKSYIEKLIKKDKLKFLKGLNLLKIKRYNYLINQFKKEIIYLKLKQKMLFNEFKFNELYITPLIHLLQTIYKKKIEFNIIILKNYYLSSSILLQIITAKVRSVKNRGKALKPIDKVMSIINVPKLSKNKLPRMEKSQIGVQNVIFNKFKKINKKDDCLNEFIKSNKSKIWSSKFIDKLVLKNLENKSVAGIFIKIAGRLTKRYKAERAINQIKHIGTLKNVHSAHKGYSSVLSRGYNNINVEKTMIHSKMRIGAFGITGWVASY